MRFVRRSVQVTFSVAVAFGAFFTPVGLAMSSLDSFNAMLALDAAEARPDEDEGEWNPIAITFAPVGAAAASAGTPSGVSEEAPSGKPEAEPMPVSPATPANALEVASAPKKSLVRTTRSTNPNSNTTRPQLGRNGTEAARLLQSGKAKKSAKCGQPIDEIQAVADGQWTIDKKYARYYTNHLGEANKLGWAEWHFDRRGKKDGFVVHGIRCGSPLHQAGLRNNDVVYSINKTTVKNIPQAIGAYLKLLSANDITLSIERKGEEKVLKYNLE